jgi:thiamine pyrophosphate-dependent acetolactate synthase large subunit-like protein
VLKEQAADARPDRTRSRPGGEQIDEWRGIDCLRYDRTSPVIKPQFAVETLYKVTNGELFLTSDVGQHQMFAAQFYPFDKPRRWINSGGLGTMGFGLPAAMGVQLAFPDAQVACISGEASILMCIQEMATCKQYDLPVKVCCSTTATWAWCASGRSSSTRAATPTPTSTRCRTSCSWPRASATSACASRSPTSSRRPCARPSR